MRSLSARDKKGSRERFVVKAARILAAIVMLILANVLELSAFISIILSIAAALTAGFDIILNAADSIGKKDFLNSNLIILFATIVGFAASCFKEACLLVIMYQVGVMLLEYSLSHSKSSMLKAVSDENGYFDIEAISEILNQPKATKSSILTKAVPIMDMLLKAALIVGVLYAIIMPLISEMTFVMSIRRGLMLILAAAPAAALVSLPLCAETGIAFSTLYGSIIKDSSVLEKISSVNTIVFDKKKVFSDGAPKLVSLSSPVLDSGTFKALAAYIAYNSSLSIAAPIVAAYRGTVNAKYIESFNDLPGDGMEITIHGVRLSILSKDILDLRGIAIPEAEVKDGLTFYMIIGGKYAGRLCFKENINPYAQELVTDLKENCGIKTILISEESENATASFASAIGVDEFRYACAPDEKDAVIQDIKDETPAGKCLVYVSAEIGELHSAADIDLRTDDEEAGDINMNTCMALPAIYAISERVIKRQKANLTAMLVLKLVLIILAMTGSATMWFIVFADMVLAALSVLNASRDPGIIVGD